MLQRAYYTLIASLPALPRFERARTLPINPERLETRLRMLDAKDCEVLEAARAFLTWQRLPLERGDAEIVDDCRRLLQANANRTLHAVVGHRMALRTVMAALRRRRRGQGPPPAGEAWGFGPHLERIQSHWAEPDLGLAQVHPWLPEARRLLEAGEALALQRLLMGLSWDRLDQAAALQPFAFDAVLVYVLKWDILRRWLGYNPEPAARRFEQLLTDTLGSHAQLFA